MCSWPEGKDVTNAWVSGHSFLKARHTKAKQKGATEVDIQIKVRIAGQIKTLDGITLKVGGERGAGPADETKLRERLVQQIETKLTEQSGKGALKKQATRLKTWVNEEATLNKQAKMIADKVLAHNVFGSRFEEESSESFARMVEYIAFHGADAKLGDFQTEQDDAMRAGEVKDDMLIKALREGYRMGPHQLCKGGIDNVETDEVLWKEAEALVKEWSKEFDKEFGNIKCHGRPDKGPMSYFNIGGGLYIHDTDRETKDGEVLSETTGVHYMSRAKFAEKVDNFVSTEGIAEEKLAKGMSSRRLKDAKKLFFLKKMAVPFEKDNVLAKDKGKRRGQESYMDRHKGLNSVAGIIRDGIVESLKVDIDDTSKEIESWKSTVDSVNRLFIKRTGLDVSDLPFDPTLSLVDALQALEAEIKEIGEEIDQLEKKKRTGKVGPEEAAAITKQQKALREKQQNLEINQARLFDGNMLTMEAVASWGSDLEKDEETAALVKAIRSNKMPAWFYLHATNPESGLRRKEETIADASSVLPEGETGGLLGFAKKAAKAIDDLKAKRSETKQLTSFKKTLAERAPLAKHQQAERTHEFVNKPVLEKEEQIASYSAEIDAWMDLLELGANPPATPKRTLETFDAWMKDAASSKKR